MARLLEPVERGESVLSVGTELDWVVGDRLYIAPSGVDSTQSEYRTVSAYENGKIYLDRAANFYHFGATSSTEFLYNGVDIRCEVVLLSRNIIINGDDPDGHGAQIFATDLLEANGLWRNAQVRLDSVEIMGCS